jgi:hypothetical protein
MKRQEIENNYGKTWNTKELQETFKVLGFSMGYCVVQDKKTDERGSLSFNQFEVEGEGAVRLYYGFMRG